MMMFDWMNHEDAVTLCCPLTGRSCKGLFCHAWATHPDEADERGRCGLLAALEGVLQR